ncbi:hypothetical protein Ctha_2256 [Chloroherpeton thalassium ATCC 35110]|uniref:VWFA domain-containing protein n=1 Tax=Chloroherpeton thalassium (strain ATCC 35110 / GB-78) TaxID=517418 RepID=B3QW53_CHLT3|nr:hypothetical protein [Chloroherpeton thalassium]ACF14707.1 hypothetical protein Ctha_2256 [Chloroherpeton thalassium ATCC 35110]
MLPELDLTLSHPWLATVFALLAIGLSVYAYAQAPISTPVKGTLISLRSASLFFALLLLLEPVIGKSLLKTNEPVLALALDNSESMRIEDAGLRRSDALKEIMSNYRDKIKTLGELKTYGFGKSLRKLELDSLHFDEKETNLSETIRALGRRRAENSAKAILLVSDGQFTAGENPIDIAEESSVPIYTLLIGDTLQKRDITVKRIIAPVTAVAGSKIPVSVILSQQGFTGNSLSVELSGGGEENLSLQKTLSLSGKEETLSFEISAKTPGEKKFVINSPPLAGEFSTRNNALPFYINILKSRKKILVISGLAEPEISGVRSALGNNKNLEASFFIQRNPQAFLDKNLTSDDFKDADACILLGFPSDMASNELSNQVLQLLAQSKLPVFTFVTAQTLGAKLKRFEKLLSVTLGKTRAENDYETVFAAPTNQATSSPIFKSLTSPLEDALQKAPPLGYQDFGFAPKNNATALWNMQINARKTDMPIFAITNSQSQKFATFCASGFWQFHLSPDPEVRDLYERTILNTIEWLTTRDDIERFSVKPASKIFEAGDQILFSASLQDETLSPISNANITLKAIHQKTKQIFETVFDSQSEAGLYLANFESLPEGDYSFLAVANENTRVVGKASGIFSVSETGAEYRLPQAQSDVLREMAHRSGGKFYTAANFASFFSDLLKDMSFQKADVMERKSYELSNASFSLILIFSLLTIEWLIRKLNTLP